MEQYNHRWAVVEDEESKKNEKHKLITQRAIVEAWWLSVKQSKRSGFKPHRRVVSVNKYFCSTKSLFTKVYIRAPETYSRG